MTLQSSSFAEFDIRAKAGAVLNVVFFGASLTWGANSSDPQLTSYRGNIARCLEAEYPQAHFKFSDASIGGTTSQLGAFRFERDVLGRHPDLVFLDFSLNDGMYSDDPETMASYEALVRRCILDAHAPVVQVIFPSRGMAEQGHTRDMRRRDAHLAISKAYNTAIGDAIVHIQEHLRLGRTTAEELWPFDPDNTHPGDSGYALYAEAAWRGFKDAVRSEIVCAAPSKVLYAETYLKPLRMPLSALSPLPFGWQTGSPNTTSAHYDMLMSRWFDSEVIVNNSGKGHAGTLTADFIGSTVMVFGESTLQSGSFRVLIDRREAGKAAVDKLIDAAGSAGYVGGNAHLVAVLATNLDPNRIHRIKIVPILVGNQELRLESLCIAGAGARLELAAVKAISVPTRRRFDGRLLKA